MEKTIRMPKELLEKWLAALRSGEYKQATGKLYDPECNGYCCLGLLQYVADGATCGGDGLAEDDQLPSSAWLLDHSVSFIGHGDDHVSPKLPALGARAHIANDSGKTFAEIADAIESCAEGI